MSQYNEIVDIIDAVRQNWPAIISQLESNGVSVSQETSLIVSLPECTIVGYVQRVTGTDCKIICDLETPIQMSYTPKCDVGKMKIEITAPIPQISLPKMLLIDAIDSIKYYIQANWNVYLNTHSFELNEYTVLGVDIANRSISYYDTPPANSARYSIGKYTHFKQFLTPIKLDDPNLATSFDALDAYVKLGQQPPTFTVGRSFF